MARTPHLNDKVCIPGTIWHGRIVGCWQPTKRHDIEIMVEWSSETRAWGTGGRLSDTVYQLRDLTWIDGAWIAKPGNGIAPR